MLPRFTQALQSQKKTMDYNQFWRYKGGRLPRLLVWLAERPELAEALAEDAREMRAAESTAGRRDAA